jgi:uncharacterized protein involved in exopolysaccharide biosynthesis
MKRILKFLALLYPSAWRRRYAAEYEALLEEREPRWRDVVDVAWAAVKLWATRWSFVRVVLPCVIAGGLVAVVISFVVPAKYASQTVMTIMTTNQPASGPADDLRREYLDRDTLTSVIQKLNLYPRERRHMALKDVVDRMERNIHLRTMPVTSHINPDLYEPMLRIKPGKLEKLNLAVQFDYPDPHLAQQVEGALISHAVSSNLRLAMQRREAHPDSSAGAVISIERAPSLPEKPDGLNRTELGAIVLLGGLVGGLVLAAAIGWRRRVTVAAD